MNCSRWSQLTCGRTLVPWGLGLVLYAVVRGWIASGFDPQADVSEDQKLTRMIALCIPSEMGSGMRQKQPAVFSPARWQAAAGAPAARGRPTGEGAVPPHEGMLGPCLTSLFPRSFHSLSRDPYPPPPWALIQCVDRRTKVARCY